MLKRTIVKMCSKIAQTSHDNRSLTGCHTDYAEASSTRKTSPLQTKRLFHILDQILRISGLNDFSAGSICSLSAANVSRRLRFSERSFKGMEMTTCSNWWLQFLGARRSVQPRDSAEFDISPQNFIDPSNFLPSTQNSFIACHSPHLV